MSCKHEARCSVLTAQQSIDESGQMSWQGDLDIPVSYGTFPQAHTLCPNLIREVARASRSPAPSACNRSAAADSKRGGV